MEKVVLLASFTSLVIFCFVRSAVNSNFLKDGKFTETGHVFVFGVFNLLVGWPTGSLGLPMQGCSIMNRLSSSGGQFDSSSTMWHAYV